MILPRKSRLFSEVCGLREATGSKAAVRRGKTTVSSGLVLLLCGLWVLGAPGSGAAPRARAANAPAMGPDVGAPAGPAMGPDVGAPAGPATRPDVDPSAEGRPDPAPGDGRPETAVLLEKGISWQSAGDLAKAEDLFRRGLERKPDDPELRAALAGVLARSGRAAEAAVEYTRMLVLSPDDAGLHAGLARALVNLGDLAEAGRHFNRSVDLDPHCDVYADLGQLQDVLGREDLAQESYEKGIALDPTCSAPRMHLASMWMEDGRYEEAALQYREAIAAQPTAAAHSGLGFALNQLGRLDEAAAEHEKAVALDESLAVVHRNRALTQARLGHYEQAITSYRRAVAIEPRVSTYYALGGVLRAAGRREEAEVAYESGRELSARATVAPARPR